MAKFYFFLTKQKCQCPYCTGLFVWVGENYTPKEPFKLPENEVVTYNFRYKSVAYVCCYALNMWHQLFGAKQHHGGDHPFDSRDIVYLSPVFEVHQLVEPVTYRG